MCLATFVRFVLGCSWSTAFESDTVHHVKFCLKHFALNRSKEGEHSSVVSLLIHPVCILSVLGSLLACQINVQNMSLGWHMLRGNTFVAIISTDKISIYITKSKTRLFPRNLVFSNGPYVFAGFGLFRYKWLPTYISIPNLQQIL